MGDDAPPPPSGPARWLGRDRAAVLFVGIPLLSALVLAATPLSEPPKLTDVAALPSRLAGPERAGAHRAVAVPPYRRAPLHGSAAVRAPLSARRIVEAVEGVERVATQAP